MKKVEHTNCDQRVDPHATAREVADKALQPPDGTTGRLLGNMTSLLGLQMANYLFPLITLPYLVRVLGPEKFGLIAFAQALIQYFILFTDYGFNLSATREISIHRDNPNKLAEIFSAVFLIKTGMMLLSFLILSILVFTIGKFTVEWKIYLLTAGSLIGNLFIPVWFFQGLEQMKYLTIINVASRFIFLVGVFALVRNASDYLLVPLLNSLGALVSGGLSMTLVLIHFRLKPKLPSFKALRHHQKEGLHVFLAVITSSLYTTSIPFILGLLTNNAIVGFYSAGEKVIRGLEGLVGILTQSLYPHVSRLASQSREQALRFIRKITAPIGLGTLLLSASVVVFSPWLTRTIFGNQFGQSVAVLRILALLLVCKGVGHIFLIQTMLTFKESKAALKIVLSAAALSLCASLTLIPPFHQTGAALAAVLPEAAVLVISFLFVENRYHIFGLIPEKSS